jgi:putative inorganic carbon (HCO3(-)) transporter
MTRDRIENVADRILEYLLYGLVFCIPLFSAAAEVFFYVSLLVFIVKKIARPRFELFKDLTYIFLFIFLFFCLLSLSHSGVYIQKSAKAFFFKWLKYLFLFMMMHETFSKSLKRLQNVIFVFISVGGLIACDGLYQKITRIDFLENQIMERGRVLASFHNENSLAAYLGCVLFVVLAYALNLNFKSPRKYVCLLISFLMGLCLMFTFSRGAWFAFFTGMLLFLLLLRKKTISLAFLGILAFSFFFPEVRDRVLVIFHPGGDSFRLSIWGSALGMIRDNPFFGKGLGTFMDHFPKYTTMAGTYYAHNCFLQIAAESGIFSLISFLGFLYVLVKRGIAKYNESRDLQILGLTCAVFVFLVNSFFEVHFYSLSLAMLFWSLAGILFAYIHIPHRRDGVKA